jgi:hypothetical protein
MGAADDAACRLEIGSNGHDAARMASPVSRDLAADHCVVCHLQRALGGAFVADSAALVSPVEGFTCAVSSQTSPVSAAVAAPSSRGPPALFL